MNNFATIFFAVVSFASPSEYTFSEVLPKFTNRIKGVVMNPTPQYVNVRAEDYIYLNEMIAERDCLLNGSFSVADYWDMSFPNDGTLRLDNPLKEAASLFSAKARGWDTGSDYRFIRDITYPREMLTATSDDSSANWCLNNLYPAGEMSVGIDSVTAYGTNALPKVALKADILTGMFTRLGSLSGVRVMNCSKKDCMNNFGENVSHSRNVNSISNFANGVFSYYPVTDNLTESPYEDGFDNSIEWHEITSDCRWTKDIHERYFLQEDGVTADYATSAVGSSTSERYDRVLGLNRLAAVEEVLIATNSASERVTDVQGWILYEIEIWARRYRVSEAGDEITSSTLVNLERTSARWYPTQFTRNGRVDVGLVKTAAWEMIPAPQDVFAEMLEDVGESNLRGGWTSPVTFADPMPDPEAPHEERTNSRNAVVDDVEVVFRVGHAVLDYKIKPSSVYKEAQ